MSKGTSIKDAIKAFEAKKGIKALEAEEVKRSFQYGAGECILIYPTGRALRSDTPHSENGLHPFHFEQLQVSEALFLFCLKSHPSL